MLKLFLISHGFNLNAPRICFKYTGIRFFNSKIFSVHRKIEISKIHTKNSSKTVRWIGIDGYDKKLMYGSWMFLGFSFWIILGTTSFVSFALWLADKFQIQECVAKKLGRFLEKNIKVGIEFHGDIVPNWKIRRIVFNSISINNINRPDWEGYSKFDLFIDKLEISISLKKWLEGKGLIVDLYASGVRGKIDQVHKSSDEYIDWKYIPQPGDFHLDRMNINDAYLTISNPKSRKNFELSIISASLPRLRKRFLLYDILSANSIVGIIDKSLFSLHVPQKLDKANSLVNFDILRHFKIQALDVSILFGHPSTIRAPLCWIDSGSVDIDILLQLPRKKSDLNRGKTISFGEVSEKIIADILRSAKTKFPNSLQYSSNFDGEKIAFGEKEEQLCDEIINTHGYVSGLKASLLEPVLTRIKNTLIETNVNLEENNTESPEKTATRFMNASPDSIAFKIDLKFHNLKAQIPWSRDHSSFKTTISRPIVAYINDKKPKILLSCKFEIRSQNFDGSWTIHDSGISKIIADSISKSFEELASNRQKKAKRIQKISLWSLHMALRSIRDFVDQSNILFQDAA